MAPNPADPIALIAQILALFVGITLAEMVAPHIVVMLAGVVGGVFGLMAWRQCTRLEALSYVGLAAAGAWLFAGAASALLQNYTPLDNPTPLLAPCAAVIAWIGHRWPVVLVWGLRRFTSLKGPQP